MKAFLKVIITIGAISNIATIGLSAESSRAGDPTPSSSFLRPASPLPSVRSDSQIASILASTNYSVDIVNIPNTRDSGGVLKGARAAALPGAPSGFTIVTATSDPSGFRGVAFKEIATDLVVVTFRGTEKPSDLTTWPAIVTQTADSLAPDGTSTPSAFGKQLDAAKSFTDSVTADFGTFNTILAGHSLGGAECQMESARTGVTCYADNSPGMAKLIKATYPDAATAQIHTQCSDGDLVCKVGTQPGTVDYYHSVDNDLRPQALLSQHSAASLSGTIAAGAQPILSCDEDRKCGPPAVNASLDDDFDQALTHASETAADTSRTRLSELQAAMQTIAAASQTARERSSEDPETTVESEILNDIQSFGRHAVAPRVGLTNENTSSPSGADLCAQAIGICARSQAYCGRAQDILRTNNIVCPLAGVGGGYDASNAPINGSKPNLPTKWCLDDHASGGAPKYVQCN